MRFRIFLIYVTFVILLILSIPFLLIVKINNSTFIKVKFIKFFSKIASFVAGNKCEIIGKENIPKGEHFLLVANHEGMFDFCNIFMAFDEPIGFVSKIENSKIPIFNLWMNEFNSVYIDRSDMRQSTRMLSKAADNIQKFNSIGIMPEGTRSMDRMEFKPGGLKIAQKANCKILPCTLIKTGEILECRKGFGSVKTKIIIHTPIHEDIVMEKKMVTLASEIESIIYEAYE